MIDKISQTSGDQWYWPGFAKYGPAMARQLTNFLFSDPANPFSEDPTTWAKTGLVRTVTRTLTYANITNGSTVTQDTRNFGGGRNYVIIGRQASAVIDGTATSINLAAVRCKQTQADGTILDDDAPAINTFGSAELPFILVSPDMVLGTATRRWAATNSTGSTIDLDLTFDICFLDIVGR